MHIRKDDTVEVIAGDDKGVTGRVLRILPDKGKIVVEGVNRVYKHMKPTRRNMQGGRLSREMPIDISNVLLWCPQCRRGVKVGFRYDPGDGRKERFCRQCTGTLGALSKARPAYVEKT